MNLQETWSLFVTIKGQTSEYRLLPTMRVGRDKRLADVIVRHAHISRHHFTVHRGPDGFMVETAHKPDNNPHGTWASIRTYVNDQPVPTKAALQPGDLITVKPEEEVNEVTFKVGPSQNPIEPGNGGSGKPWWKFW